jgi:hypothetical protein
MFWFDWVTEIAQQLGSLDCLNNPLITNPTEIFDCLLGKRRPHRDWIYDRIVQSDECSKKILLNYYGVTQHWIPGQHLDQHSADQTDYTNSPDRFFTGIQIPYYANQTCYPSQLLPWKIYNQTWFSIVSETSPDQSFFTEKTAKVLIARRLFVIVGARHSLRNLKTLGFQTFDTVLDEAYDDEVDDHLRWQKAWLQIQNLCSQDPAIVYQKILPVLEHNQQLILSVKWIDRMKQEIKNLK